MPMLGRAALMPTVRDSLRETAGTAARIIWLCTSGDDEVLAEAARLRDAYTVSPPRAKGDYPAKINLGATNTTEPLIFLGAGDIRFHPGWLDACLARLTAPGVGVVGTNDLCNPRTASGALSTHTLVTRRYASLGSIDNPAALLHPNYWHEFVDDEFVASAKYRGAYAHAPDAIVEHLHPDAGKRPADRIDGQRQQRMAHGRRLFNARRHLWT